jgi:UDP-2-acetamido-3-amino-2,3-dideoxy-glucuronate N-acetyltransferase
VRPEPRVHPTAIVETGVTLGPGTSVWDGAHLRRGVTVGGDCIVGGKAYLGPGVTVGDRCKINSFAYVCIGVTLETGVMVAAGATFTNDRHPRATTPDLRELRPSDAGDDTELTLVREGATVGAGAVIGCGLTVGRFALVGMGAVVTRSVPDFALVVGSPARRVGVVCRCGKVLLRHEPGDPADGALECDCGRRYRVTAGTVGEVA